MRTVYVFLLWLAEFELQIALSAPVLNPKNIKSIEGDIERWSDAIWYIDHPLLP
jgi:hypothetical protein